MNKDENDLNQAKWSNFGKAIKSLKEKGVKTLIGFFVYIARSLTIALLVTISTIGAKPHSETLLTILTCAMIGIFLIEIFIVTYLKYHGKL